MFVLGRSLQVYVKRVLGHELCNNDSCVRTTPFAADPYTSLAVCDLARDPRPEATPCVHNFCIGVLATQVVLERLPILPFKVPSFTCRTPGPFRNVSLSPSHLTCLLPPSRPLTPMLLLSCVSCLYDRVSSLWVDRVAEIRGDKGWVKH